MTPRLCVLERRRHLQERAQAHLDRQLTPPEARAMRAATIRPLPSRPPAWASAAKLTSTTRRMCG